MGLNLKQEINLYVIQIIKILKWMCWRCDINEGENKWKWVFTVCSTFR